MLVMMALSVCTATGFPQLPALQFILGSIIQAMFFFIFRSVKVRSSSYKIFLGFMVLGCLGTFILAIAVMNIGSPPCLAPTLPSAIPPQTLQRIADHHQMEALFQWLAFATDIMTGLCVAIGSYIAAKEHLRV